MFSITFKGKPTPQDKNWVKIKMVRMAFFK